MIWTESLRIPRVRGVTKRQLVSAPQAVTSTGRRLGVRMMLAVWGLGIVSTLGCGDGLSRVPIEGTVVVDNEPLPSGVILLEPLGGLPGGTIAAEVQNGNFTVPREQGPVLGTYQVRVMSDPPADIPWDDPVAFAAVKPKQLREQRIASQFSERSTLQITLAQDPPQPLRFEVAWE